ncbi:MAG: hypothetical protein ACYC3S_01275 [Chloroflexota bacterium]
MADERKAPMTVREAGRKGGETTSKKHGRGFYESIGRKGGRTVSEKYGHEHFEEIGRKGGRKVADLISRGKAAEGQ